MTFSSSAGYASAPLRRTQFPVSLANSRAAVSPLVDAVAAFGPALDEPTPHGTCVAVRLPDREEAQSCALDAECGDTLLSSLLLPAGELHLDEESHLRSLQLPRQVLFAGGRLALRRALQSLAVAHAGPVLPDEHGAPALPDGLLGSISHTDGLAVALVSNSPDARAAVGVDVESASRPASLRIAPRILAAKELPSLGRLAGMSEHTELTLRFSLKEALYKALHPLVLRPIRWHSVVAHPAADGSCTLDWSELERQAGITMHVEARWREHAGYFITTARARLERGSGALTPGEHEAEGPRRARW